MVNSNFKVSSSKEEKIFTTIVILTVEILITFAILLTDRIVLTLIVFHVSVTPFCILLMLSTLLFKVDVFDNKIKVRSNLGRKFEFDISDINVVKCEKNSSIKGGAHYFMILVTKAERLQIPDGLIGFDTMAGYLLDKLQSGEIAKNVISHSCQETLVTYKNNEYMPKKRCKKGKHQDESE